MVYNYVIFEDQIFQIQKYSFEILFLKMPKAENQKYKNTRIAIARTFRSPVENFVQTFNTPLELYVRPLGLAAKAWKLLATKDSSMSRLYHFVFRNLIKFLLKIKKCSIRFFMWETLKANKKVFLIFLGLKVKKS